MGWRETLEGLYRSRDWTQASAQDREKAVKDVIHMSSLGAAAVSVTPVPLVDLVVTLPLQGAMVMAVAHVKGRDLSKEESLTVARELGAVVGAHLVARQAFIALARLVFPGAGGLLAAPWAFAVTYGMGRVAEAYFDNPDAPGDALRDRFKQGMEDAKKAFSKDAFMDFMDGKGKEARDFAAGEKAAEPAPEERKDVRVVEAEWGDEGGSLK
jgi:uncharacterized protein (DUF697 family)